MTYHPWSVSPTYFLGALVTDGAPMRKSVKLARGYAAALEEHEGKNDGVLHDWKQAMAGMCLSSGWQEAAIAMLATESEHQATIYEQRAEKVLRRVGQED